MSIKKQGKVFGQLELLIMRGSDHIQIPFVQGLKVAPTPKPDVCWVFKITLFNRNDFPVLYFPTKLIIPMLAYSFWVNKVLASSGIRNLLSWNITKGIAFGFLLIIVTLFFFAWAWLEIRSLSKRPFPLKYLSKSDIDSSFINEFLSISIYF